MGEAEGKKAEKRTLGISARQSPDCALNREKCCWRRGPAPSFSFFAFAFFTFCISTREAREEERGGYCNIVLAKFWFYVLLATVPTAMTFKWHQHTVSLTLSAVHAIVAILAGTETFKSSLFTFFDQRRGGGFVLWILPPPPLPLQYLSVIFQNLFTFLFFILICLWSLFFFFLIVREALWF